MEEADFFAIDELREASVYFLFGIFRIRGGLKSMMPTFVLFFFFLVLFVRLLYVFCCFLPAVDEIREVSVRGATIS